MDKMQPIIFSTQTFKAVQTGYGFLVDPKSGRPMEAQAKKKSFKQQLRGEFNGFDTR